MDVNESTKELNISDQELSSIARYMGSFYNTINLLLNMEPYKAAKLENSNWVLPESVEDVFENIEMFKNIYFAMLKNKGEIGTRLYRGISDKECKYYNGRTERIINTLYDEEKAKEFIDSEFPAIIVYTVDGEIPYIDISKLNDGKGIEGTSEGILLSPSANISQFEFVKEENGIKYYESTLKDGNFSEVDDILGEKENLEQYIRENFNGFRKYITEARSTQKVEFDIKYKKAFEFKKKLAEYVKIVAREKELELNKEKQDTKIDDKQEEVIDSSNKKIIRNEDAKYAIRRIDNVPKEYRRIFEILVKYVSEIEKRDGQELYEAQLLGIPYERRIDPVKTKERIGNISIGMQAIAEHIKGLEITETKSNEEVVERFESVRDFVSAAESLKTDLAGIDYLPYIFDEQMSDFFLERVDRRSFDIIKNLRIAKLEKELEIIPERPSLIQRITGRTKLNELRRKNVELKIEEERLSEYKPKRTYSILESLADIEAEKQVLNYTNGETESFIGAIVSRYGDEITGTRLKELVDMRIVEKTHLPINFDNKRVKSKDQLEYLEKLNEYLQKDIEFKKLHKQGVLNYTEEPVQDIADEVIFERMEEILKQVERHTIVLAREKGLIKDSKEEIKEDNKENNGDYTKDKKEEGFSYGD